MIKVKGLDAITYVTSSETYIIPMSQTESFAQ